LVIKVSRDPAEKTSTTPLCFEVVELGGLDVVVVELPQAVTASPMQATDTRAAT
jgi:hypothetical protein